MSRMVWMVLVWTLLLTGCGRDEPEKGMDVVGIRAEIVENGTIEHLAIVTNTDGIEDWEACAEEIIERCVNNDFQSVHFSYDLNEYPVGLHAEVYLTEEDMRNGVAVFSMSYMQDESSGYQYNIKDYPEKFSLELKGA